MKKKNGFTLTEILVVIALIGGLILLITPNLTSIFSGSIKNTMKVQETSLSNVADMYLDDYCRNKLEGNSCPLTINQNIDYTYSGYVTLETLIKLEYIEEITLKDSNCNGCVIFENDKPTAYLECENDSYKTDTKVDFKTICGI